MKSKAFWRYYSFTALILAVVAAVPLWNFIAMMLSSYHIAWMQYNVVAVIPFMATLTAILVGFLVLPLLRNMPPRIRNICVSLGALIIFFVLELCAEAISGLDAQRMFTTRRAPLPHEITISDFIAHLSPAARIHYYIFSIILVLTVLNFLYGLARTLYDDGKPQKRIIIFQGIAMACYAAAYFFVRVIRYDNHMIRQLTWGSVLNVAVCFMLASLVVGLFSGSLLRIEGRKRIVPSLLSALTVLAFYCAEYAMLYGGFYSYGENVIVTILIRILIVMIPAVTVYLLIHHIR